MAKFKVVVKTKLLVSRLVHENELGSAKAMSRGVIQGDQKNRKLLKIIYC